MAGNSFPLVRGRAIRVTELDGCGKALDANSVVVTDGFVSVALSADIEDAEPIEVKNANGQTCVREPGCAEFKGYSVDITFCQVDPCLFTLLTGQQTIVDDQGRAIGFRMATDRKACDYNFALEMWSNAPTKESVCDDAGNAVQVKQDPGGYLVLPFLRAGVIGDFTLENAEVTFTVQGAVSKDGNLWKDGLYPVMHNAAGVPSKLADPLTGADHLGVMFTTLAAPRNTDGCVPFVDYTYDAIVVDPGDALSGSEFSSITASDAGNAAKLAGLHLVARPKTAWTSGQKITVNTFAFHWDGTQWAAGAVTP